MKKLFIHSYLFLFVLGTVFLVSCQKSDINNSNTPYLDSFASCIADSGAKLYAAFWCPHCNEQKKMFGNSWKNIESRVYVECSKPDRTQTEVCRQLNIRAYPTWKFADGSELIGKQDFSALSQKTGCILA